MSPCQHGDNANHVHNADHVDSADNGDTAHHFLEEMLPHMLVHFTECQLQYSHMQISIFILLFL